MRIATSLLACAALAGCVTEPVAAPPPVATQPLPIIVKNLKGPALEALVHGTLSRRGDCLYLTGSASHPALIVWGDDVRAARLDDDGWVVTDLTTGQRFVEGDRITGGGGFLPEKGGVEFWTGEPPPAGCDGTSSVTIYDVKKVVDKSVTAASPPPAPPPPAPRPWRSPLLDEAYRSGGVPYDAPRRTIAAVADPLEAMSLYILQDYRGWQGVHKCLRGANDALRARLAKRAGPVEPEAACAWRDGGVVLEANGEKATFVDAQVDCTRQAKLGFCAGAAGATYGNLGAEHGAFRLRRKGDGWEIERLGIGVIS